VRLPSRQFSSRHVLREAVLRGVGGLADIQFPSATWIGTAVQPIACMLFSPLLLVGSVLAQDRRSPPVANPALRVELLARLAQDQAIRDEPIPKGLEQLTEDDKGRWLAIDADNTVRMKAVLQQYGWPGPELVGRDGSEVAYRWPNASRSPSGCTLRRSHRMEPTRRTVCAITTLRRAAHLEP
jgi:hypothetical protein